MAYNVDDFNKILADINAKIDNLASDSEEKSVLIESMKNAFDNKSSVEIERLEEFSEDLNNIKSMLDNGMNAGDSGQILDALRTLEQSFKNEILNVTFDKERLLEGLRDDIVKVIEKSAYLEELYPSKNSDYLDDIKKTIGDNLAHVQNNINGHIKEDYEMLAQAIGALYGYLEKIKKDITANGSDGVAQIASNMQIMSGNTAGLVAKIDELMSMVSARINDKDEFVNMLNSAKSKVDEIESLLSANFAEQLDDLKMDIALITTRVDSAKEDLKKSYKSEIASVLESIQNSTELISDFKENVASKLADYLNSIREALGSFVDDMKASQESFNSELYDKKLEEFQKLSDDFNKLDEGLVAREADYKDFVSHKLEEVYNSMETVKELISSSNYEINSSLSEKIAVIEDMILKKSLLKDEKLETLENTLNDYLSVIKDNLNRFDVEFKTFDDSITSKVNSVSDVLNNVSGKTDEIALNIRTNLSNQISDLKTDISVAGDKVDLLKEEMNQVSTHALSQIMTGLQNSSSEIGEFKENVSLHMSEYLTAIKDALESFSDDMRAVQDSFDSEEIEQKLTELQHISQDIQKLDADLNYRESNYKGYIDEKIAEIHNYLVTLEDMISSSGIGIENSIAAKIATIEELIAQKDYTEPLGKISETLYGVAGKTDEQISNIKEIKELINSVFQEIQTKNENLQSVISENGSHTELMESNFLNQLKELETRIQDYSAKHKLDTYEKISEISGLISAVKGSVDNFGGNSLVKIEEKLSALELELSDNYSAYDENLTVLQNKLGEYVISAEKIASETGSKIENSLLEVVEIKNELKNLYEKFDSLSVNNNGDTERHFEIVINKLNDVITEIDSSRDGIGENFRTSIQDSIEFVDKGLGYISANLGEIKAGQTNNLQNITETVDEKINELKEQLSLINTDIIQALGEKGEFLLSEFAPLKDAISKFTSFNFENIIEEIKNQIQLSYLNLLSEINDNLTDNQDAYVKIENTYRDIVSRCTSLEDYLNDFTKNNLELMSSTIANIDNNVKVNLDKTNSFFDDWRNSVEELNSCLRDNGKEFEHSLVDILDHIDRTLDEKLLSNEKDIQDYFSRILQEQNFVQLIEGANKELADKIEELKFGITDGLESEFVPEDLIDSIRKILQNSIAILNDKFDAIDARLDVIARNDNTEIIDGITESSEKIISSLDELGIKIENFNIKDNAQDLQAINSNCEEIEKSISELHSKVDIIAMADNSELQDEISQTSDKLMHSLEELHSKVDIIAMSDSSTDNDDISELSNKVAQSVAELSSKIDVLVMSDDSDFRDEVSESSEKLLHSLQELHSKVDIIAMSSESALSDELSSLSDKISKSVAELNSKIDILAMNDGTELKDEIADSSEKVLNAVNELHKKVDILAQEDNSAIQDDIEEIKELIQNGQKMAGTAIDDEVASKLDDILHTLDNSEDKIAKTLELLHNKVDILAMADDNDIKEEIQNIKELIEKQRASFENDTDDAKSKEISTHLQKLIGEINKIEKNVSELDLEKNSQDIKDSVMTAILSAMDQVSFVEETEEIKDFVEEKTNAINQTLLDVKKQLSNISSSGSDMDFYSYTLQDVESDFAKLRLTLNEISSSSTSSNEFGVISANINKMAKSIEQLQINMASHNNATPNLKADFDKLSEDILSLSARTNKILLNSTESQRIMSLSLEDFSRRSTLLENRLNELDNKQIDSRLSLIENKIDETVSSGKVLQNVMMYLGEWMDGTSETISSIYDKSVKAASVHELLENIKLTAPEQTDLLKVVEERFEEQQTRIDRLEQKLEKALEMLSEYDENIITAKIDRLDKQLGKLTENIEKLTAYVDEE